MPCMRHFANISSRKYSYCPKFSVASWKLSRTKALTAASRTEIDRVIANVQVLREDYYVVRGHTEENCFYYPDNEGGPVIQTGQCQLSDITIVPQFDITAVSSSSIISKSDKTSRYHKKYPKNTNFN